MRRHLPPPHRRTVPGLLLALVVCVARPGAATAVQEPAAACSDGRISFLFIDNHSVFDTTDRDLHGSLLWFFELANTLHMDTSPRFIRRELLFREGDCFDPLLLRESGRILREHGFIASADVYSVIQPDESRHVIVETRDEWTTQVDLGVTLDEGLQLEGIEVTEENFLGRGMLLEFSFRERRERRDFGFRFASPQTFGSQWDLETSVGRTRIGSFWSEAVLYPFLGEVGRTAFRHRLGRREALFAYAVEGDPDFTHVTVPVDEEVFETTAARRFGRPGRFLVLGAGLSRETRVFPGTPGSVEVVPEGDFDAALDAPGEVRDLISVQATPRSATRVNVILGLRRLRFAQRRGLDALRGTRDVPLGMRASATLGRSLDLLGEGGVEPTDDLFTRVDLLAGLAPADWVVTGRLQLEARQVFGGEPGGRGWRDALAQADAFAYWQPPAWSGHTFFARATFAGGWRSVTPFQLTLGGRAGVRGFGDDDHPGGRRLLLTVEDRVYFRWPAPNVLDMGMTLFVDGGQSWTGDAPFGTSSGFQASVGAGLRLGFPAGSRSVLRADLAFPLTGPGNQGNLIFRVVMNELLGLSGGFRDEQLQRSRRTSIDTEFEGVSR